MNFDGKYLEFNQKRIKGIIDFYGHKFFYFKKVLDLGCGYADISASLLRLGSDITAVDARQEHLKIVNKKYAEIKTVKADLDKGWPFPGKRFDLILNLDLICHINNYEDHLKNVCASTHHLILETAVCDSDDPYKHVVLAENKNNYDLSFNGNGTHPTTAAIERILRECGMDFKRIDQSKFNSGNYKYDWQSKNTGECSINNRRIWFAVRNDSPIQFVPNPTPKFVPKIPVEHHSHNVQYNQVLPPLPPFNTGLDKSFVVVIPSYNNVNWCQKNIESAINQNYSNYRVIFTDDCSSDDTFNRTAHIVNNSGKAEKFTLIKNATRIGALANLYNMIHSCADHEIVLTLDGDDWFPDAEVLNKLNKHYSDDNIWITYGQYKNFPDGGIGVAEAYPPNIINNNLFRHHKWGASHLRTFYSWLFKKIKKEDLFYNDSFMKMTWDLGMMFPMLEMAGQHSKFISDILYTYNLNNPINDHKVDKRLQQTLDKHIRQKPKYDRAEKPETVKPAVGLLVIATGKYFKFVNGLISSADQYFLDKRFNITYYVFTDNNEIASIKSKNKIVHIPIEHKPFPYASMDRFKHFTNNANRFQKENYLFYCDVDSLFVSPVSTEILGNTVGVRHCGYTNKVGTYETNPASTSFVPLEERKIYYGGGFSGGQKDKYLELSKWCYQELEKDFSNGIIPVYHDESILNKYFSEHVPSIILEPSYHYPEGNIEYYKKMWGKDYTKKILLLEKDHQKVRE